VGTARVLIVDDEPSFWDGCSRILSKAGYEVSPASDGRCALEVVKTRTDIDLVLSDAVMPGIQGPALLELVRTASPKTALILMSSAPQAPAPGVSFLRKPFRSAELIATVERVLAEAAQARIELAHARELGAQLRIESRRLVAETKQVRQKTLGLCESISYEMPNRPAPGSRSEERSDDDSSL
jgi:DNA-binding NtrC family response regulator